MMTIHQQRKGIEIYTLKQWLKEQAYDYAWSKINKLSELDTIAQEALRTTFSSSPEFIKILPQKVIVGINIDQIDNELSNIISQMIDAIDINPTLEKSYFFGDTIKVF